MALEKKRGGGGGSADDETGGEQRTSTEIGTALIARATGLKALQYAVVDGLAMFEGDIILGTVEEVEQATAQARAEGDVFTESVVITGDRFRWKNCKIPFKIDPALPNQARVTDAIAHWEAKTNYRFNVRTNEPDFVTFRPSDGCSSSVGKQGGQQFVNLGPSCTKGNAIHEIGHTIGLWHEQSRQDRDLFVQIRFQNIEAGKEHNFNQHISDGDDVGPYDYGSIMHYPRNAFSKNGQDTVVPINPASASIGQRTALSAGDIAAAKSLCSPVIPTTKEGPKDGVIDTIKEQVKDIRLDTRKELVRDTIKEAVLDPIRQPGGPIKFDQIPRPGRIITRDAGGSALPFAVAAPRQAPGAAEASGGGEAGSALAQVQQLDEQLQIIAEALTQAQANAQALQQQYDETYGLLNQLLDQNDPQGR